MRSETGGMGAGMTDWNYADVWETVADVQPEAPAIVQGARTVLWDEFDRGADGLAQFLLDLDVAQQDKVARLPLQLARVHPGHVRRHEGRARAGEHELPLRRRRAVVSLGQRRRGGGRVPRWFRRPDRADPRPGARGEGLALGRRRLRALPRLGHAVRRRGEVRGGPGAGAVGAQRRRPLHALHGRHDGDAQGRHVASGRPVRPADRRRRAPLRRERRAGGRAGGGVRLAGWRHARCRRAR